MIHVFLRILPTINKINNNKKKCEQNIVLLKFVSSVDFLKFKDADFFFLTKFCVCA